MPTTQGRGSKRRADARRPHGYARGVFINCPYDAAYRPVLRAILFTLVALGAKPRIASERLDSGENRFAKIVELIGASRLAVHDVSRLRATAAGEFARLNMAFEVGLELGARWLNPDRHDGKRCLIMSTDAEGPKRALSDLAGFDIKPHADSAKTAMEEVRHWLVAALRLRDAEGATGLWARFTDFTAAHRVRCVARGVAPDEIERLPTEELLSSMKAWLKETRK
jgi:hypothetical protein